MTTARSIITQAMRKAGILTKTESPSADEAQDGLETMNMLIQSWSNDSMLITARVKEDFTLTGGQADYTIGIGQDFNTSRPTYVVSCYTRQGHVDYETAEITDEGYAENITMKNVQGRPYFYNYTNGYPTGKFRFWPVPNTDYPVSFLFEKPIDTLGLDDEVSMPNGWDMALVYNLAVHLAPEYGQPVSQALAQFAESSLDAVRRAVLKSRTMDANPSPLRAGNNIYSGWYT